MDLKNLFSKKNADANAEPKTIKDYIGLIVTICIIIIFLLIYFFLIRPNQKKEKERRNMQSSLKRGDKILTAGGLFGSVVKAKEGEERINIEISDIIL